MFDKSFQTIVQLKYDLCITWKYEKMFFFISKLMIKSNKLLHYILILSW